MKTVLARPTGGRGGTKNQNRLGSKKYVRYKFIKRLSNGVSGFVSVKRYLQEYGVIRQCIR